MVIVKTGLTKDDLAKLVGVAPITIQRICYGTLGLSEDLAKRMEEELDIAASWLLENDEEKPIVTPRGGLWSKELYEFAQGSRFFATEKKADGKEEHHYRYESAVAVSRGASDEFIAWRLTDFCARVNGMLETTRSTPRQGILVHRLEKMLTGLEKDFIPDPATLERYAPRIDGLEKAYLDTADKIYRKEIEEFSP